MAERVEGVARFVDANELERKTLHEIERIVRHGYKTIDLLIRVDGREYHFEADWIRRLLCERAPAEIRMGMRSAPLPLHAVQ